MLRDPASARRERRVAHAIVLQMPAADERTGAAGAAADTAPALSVVVAAVDAVETIDAALTALLAATAHLDTEIVVVDASTDGTRDRVAAFPTVRVISATPGTLVPHLWARGYD